MGPILLAGLEVPAFGVMVARGDLAVEAGFEDLLFVAEDILTMCEAAHVPVIWAPQLLETLTRSGLPARAGMTGAVHGQRAYCVMLNKGPHVTRACATLAGPPPREEVRHVPDIHPTAWDLHGVRARSPGPAPFPAVLREAQSP